MRVYPAASRNEWENAGTWKERDKAVEHARKIRASKDHPTRAKIVKRNGTYIVMYQFKDA